MSSYLRVVVPSCNRLPAYVYGISKKDMMENKDLTDTGFSVEVLEKIHQKEADSVDEEEFEKSLTSEQNLFLRFFSVASEIEYPLVRVYEISKSSNQKYIHQFGACSKCQDDMYIYIFQISDEVLEGNLQESIVNNLNII